MKLSISCTYNACCNADVNIPKEVNLEDISNIYVKWDCLHFDANGKHYEIELNSNTMEAVDWKRPSDINYYSDGKELIIK